MHDAGGSCPGDAGVRGLEQLASPPLLSESEAALLEGPAALLASSAGSSRSPPRPSSSRTLRAAFRAAEKRLRVRQGVPTDARGRRLAGASCIQELPSDLSEVVELAEGTGDSGGGDESDGVSSGADGEQKVARARFLCSRIPFDDADAHEVGLGQDALVFSFPAVRGLFVVRNAVAPKELTRLAVEALDTYSEPPFPTNLSVEAELAGRPELRRLGLWERSQSAIEDGTRSGSDSGGVANDGLGALDVVAPSNGGGATRTSASTIKPAASAGAGNSATGALPSRGTEQASMDPSRGAKQPSSMPSSAQSVPAGCAAMSSGASFAKPLREQTLDRLRWSCLGPYYDWTARAYVADHEQGPLPAWLRHVGVRVFGVLDRAAADLDAKSRRSAKPDGGLDVASPPPLLPTSYRPDGALVNFYSRGDVLCGHADDAEPDLAYPLVAISVGPPAAFLAGTIKDGDIDKPVVVPFWVRHGDAVVLAGPARLALHGVARVEAERDGRKRSHAACPSNARMKKALSAARDGVNKPYLESDMSHASETCSEAQAADVSSRLTPASDPDLPKAVSEYLKTHRISISLRVVT